LVSHEAVTLANVQLERAKFEKVRQRGMAEDLDGAEFNEAVNDAQAEHDEQRSAADELRDGVHEARASWEEARAAYVQIDGQIADKLFKAPPEPKYLEPEPKYPPQQHEQQAKQLPPDQQELQQQP
jgi:predicted Holliday junction resolvase-like endonuclease